MAKVKAKPLPPKKVQKPVKQTIAERMRRASKPPARSKKTAAQLMREATRIMPKKKARLPMPNDPKPREDAIAPADAPTDYPPVGIAVSTGTAWDVSITAATVPRTNVANTFTANQTFSGTNTFSGFYQWFTTQTFLAAVTYLGSPDAVHPATIVQPGGAMASPAITVAGSPVVTVAMLDPAVVNARLAALEATVDVTPPGEDPRSQTRATLSTTAQTNQSDNDLIFEQQRAEAERVQNIFNPPPA